MNSRFYIWECSSFHIGKYSPVSLLLNKVSEADVRQLFVFLKNEKIALETPLEKKSWNWAESGTLGCEQFIRSLTRYRSKRTDVEAKY